MSKSKPLPQREMVLAALRSAGSRGVHTNELRAAYCANPSERIRELEAQGYVISHTRERLHGRATGARYRLVSSPEDVEFTVGRAGREDTCAPSGSELDGRLFEVPAIAPDYGEAA